MLNSHTQKFAVSTVVKHVALLVGGSVIGYLNGSVLVGFMLTCLVIIIWHLFHMVRLHHWLYTKSDLSIPFGFGLWSEIFARIQHFRHRSSVHKQRYSELSGVWQTLIDSLADASFLLGNDYEVLSCNTEAAALLNTSVDQITGLITNHLRQPELIRYLETKDYTEPVITSAAKHPDVTLECKVSRCDRDRLLLQLVDISPRVKAMQIRSDFIANASHELRTPVTVLKGYLDTYAADDTVPGEMHEPLQAMNIQVERMRAIIADLMALNVLESAGPAVRDEVVDLGDVISEVRRQTISATAELATVEVQIDGLTGVLGSASDLYSIVSNLMANAVQFTPADGHILIHWNADHSGGTLTVRDTGIGVSKDDLPRITERFYRTGSGRAHYIYGTGLGLAIIKHALARHDATLTIDSELSSGSTFTCHFPAERIASPAA